MNNDIYGESSMFHPNPTTFDYPRHQIFSLPSTLIHYVSKNPFSADGLSKLQKTCKYFFAKNKIIILNGDTSIEYDKKYFTSLILDAPSIYKEYIIYFEMGFKYWISRTFNIQYFDSLEIKKNIYRCSLNNLYLNDVTLTMDEFDFLIYGGKVTLIGLTYVKIYDEKNSLVSIDKILEKLPNIKDFHYDSRHEIFSMETFEKMNSLVFNFKFKLFTLYINNLAPNTDVKLLCDFVKKNSGSKKFVIFFAFDGARIYKSILKSEVDKMLQTWNNVEKPPSVSVYAKQT